MKIVTVKKFSATQQSQLLDIWQKEYPVILKYKNLAEFEAYLNRLDASLHMLVVDDKGCIKGWLARLVRDGKDWIAIILDASVQHQGFGSNLLGLIKKNSVEINAWVIDHNRYKKIDGSNYKSPLSFYLKNDFIIVPDIKLKQKKFSAIKMQWKRV